MEEVSSKGFARLARDGCPLKGFDPSWLDQIIDSEDEVEISSEIDEMSEGTASSSPSFSAHGNQEVLRH